MSSLVYIGRSVTVLMSLFEGQTRALRRVSADRSCQQLVLRK